MNKPTTFANLLNSIKIPCNNGYLNMNLENIKKLVELIKEIFSGYDVTYTLVSSGSLEFLIAHNNIKKIQLMVDSYGKGASYMVYVFEENGDYNMKFLESDFNFLNKSDLYDMSIHEYFNAVIKEFKL